MSILSSANVTDVNLVLKERTHMPLCLNMLIFTHNLGNWLIVVIGPDLLELFRDVTHLCVKVVLSGGNDGFGTAQCPCHCHKNRSTAASTNSRTVSLKHCHSCALKVCSSAPSDCCQFRLSNVMYSC